MALTCKELADIWQIPVTKVTQARNPWLLKLGALLAKAPPSEFHRMCLDALTAYEETQQTLFDSELDRRTRMQTGRANKSDLNPTLF